MIMKQCTLRKCYSFEGKGLHSGAYAHMYIKPAPVGTGIRFVRTDLGLEIPAIAENVSSTMRSTTLSCCKATVRTVEHVLSALTGLGVDNAFIEIDNKEVPILDGSSRMYADAISADGVEEQDALRDWLEIDEEISVSNGKSGSFVRISPADNFSIDLTIDFDSKVIGRQTVRWSLGDDYSAEVAPCRTFCFLDEIQLLAMLGLVKGGDISNAIVVVDKPVSGRKLERLARLFDQPKISVTNEGYLNNIDLHFPDECGRHKLLDIIGDIRLAGGFPKVHVEAYKPGHAINTNAAKLLRKHIIHG